VIFFSAAVAELIATITANVMIGTGKNMRSAQLMDWF